MTDRIKWGMLVLICTCAMVVPVTADGPQTGTIDGRVLGAEGEPLPGATVTLSSARGTKTITTDDQGIYRFGVLPSGRYELTARLEGLGEAEVSAALEPGARRTIDLTLRLSTSEAITVTAEAPLVDRYVVGSSASLEAAVAKDVSFRARNYQASFDVLPGVVHDVGSRLQGDIKFAVNGGQDTETAAFIDGVDTSFFRTGGSPRLFLPTTALEQVSLDSGGLSTEYGRAVGGVASAVVKSGTNTFHGSFLYIPQNQKWRAPYKEIDIPREDEIIHSFETSLGGPIARDRAWFFAAYAEQDTNELNRFPDGTAVDAGFKNELKTLKVTLQPSGRHHLALLGIDSPVDKQHVEVGSGDRFTPCACNLSGEILTATWGYGLSSSLFLEMKAANQENGVFRETLLVRDPDPAANPDSPPGNAFSYLDLSTRLLYNSIGQPLGDGFLTIPRDQINAAVSWFAGRHELKLGADYQDVELETFNEIGRRYNGLGYGENLPGGFQTPRFVDVYDPSAVITTSSELFSAYVQDRMELGERWSLSFGLRLDDQSSENEIGEETVAWEEVAPRVAAVYDVEGTGRLLLKASAGRYVQVVPQDLVSREFSRLPNGANLFSRFNWNPATQRYDIFAQRVLPALDTAIQQVDPYHKNEVTVGTDWQFSDAWVFEAQAIWWELDDLYWATQQFDAQGRVYRDVRNWNAGFRDYRGLRLEVNRAMRNGWALRTNYVLGDGDGNNFGANDNVILHNDDMFEALGGVELGTGRTNATVVNREGHGPFHRKHNLNVVGLRHFSIGVHSVGVGAYLGFRSGERWGLRQSTQIAHPVSGEVITTTTYREPRDAQQLEDTFHLNLTGTWTFPIRGSIRGRVAVEAANLTDEQEVIGINRGNGRPLPGVFAFQYPREFRGQIGIEF